MAKLDLTIGTPVLTIFEKAMDFWLELYKAAPDDLKRDYASQIMARMLVWERIVDRVVGALLDALDGKEGS